MSNATFSRAFGLDDADADAIDAIRAELASAEKKGDERATQSLHDKLSEARIKRISRLSQDTWDILESVAGRRLRR